MKPPYEELKIRVKELEEEAVRLKHVEKAFKESEERFRNLIEGSIQGILIHRNHKPLFVNETWAAMHGYTPEEILEMESVVPLMSTQDQKRMVEYKNARQRGETAPIDYEYQGVRKDGSLVWLENRVSMVNWDGQPAIQSTIYNISERKQGEKELERSRNQLQSLFDNMLNGFAFHKIITDEKGKPVDYIFLEINKASEQLTGLKRDDIIGKKVTEVHPGIEDMAFDWIGTYGNVALTGKPIQFEEYFEPQQHWYFISAYCPFEMHFAVTFEDITEQKRAETSRKKLESQLQQAQKMEAVGALAGGIAHDFNNILTPILIQSELALMDLAEDNPIQFNIREVMKAGHRAKDLVKQILTFSRQTEQQPIPLKASSIIKEAIRLLRASIPTTIEIRFNIPKNEDAVNADPTQIHQVLMNLCTNAAHAMRDKGGALEVSLDMVELDSEFTSRHVDLEPGAYLKLSVSDTGHGISPEVLDRIFDPFFTTKDRAEGTGMGLAVVHGIIKNYGGEITVESELGKGTTFMAFIPSIKTRVDDDPKLEKNFTWEMNAFW